MTVTQEDIDAVVAFWQPRLGLRDWKIRTIIVGAGSLEGANGDCDPDANCRSTLIRINEEIQGRSQLAETLFHELLHCVFWWTPHHEDNEIAATLEEQAFDAICPGISALVVDRIWPAQPKRKP